MRGLQFDNATVPRRIKYQYPQRGIFYDEDGSLTGSAGQYATFASASERKHLHQSECTLDETLYDGVFCDSSVQIRRIAFFGYAPGHFDGQTQNILAYDDDQVLPDKETYLAEESNYGKIIFKSKKDPTNAWASAFVTGHQYRVTWANDLDFTQFQVQVSEKWEESDEDLLIVLPFVDAREAINVTNVDTGLQIDNNTLEDNAQPDWLTGYHTIENATEIREFTFVVNGNADSPKTIKLEGLQCIQGECPQEEINEGTIPSTPIPWSLDSSWESGAVPVEGEDVEIPADKWIELDIAETPILNLVTVNGRLSFKDGAGSGSINLRAKQVYVRAGELLIGSEDAPFADDAQITLYGARNEATEVMSGAVETGNKIIVNTNLLEMHGQPRSRAGRLQASVFNGQSTAKVEAGLGW